MNCLGRLIAALIIFSPVALFADIIYLNTGGIVKGKITSDDGSSITVKTQFGETEISRDDIEKIEKCESVKHLYFDKLEKLPPADPEGHYRLALWLQKINENELARDELEKTIILNPEHADARAALGYVRKKDNWVRKDEKTVPPIIRVEKKKQEELENLPDEHNLLSGASEKVKKAVKKLDSPVKSEREEALELLSGLHKYGDVRAVREYMRYREAVLIVSLQQQEGEILNILHGQLDGDLRQRQTRWFERFRQAGDMRERLHSRKTLDLLVKEELSRLKKLSADDCTQMLRSHRDTLILLEETSSWLEAGDIITTEFGSCLTDVYRALLLARAGEMEKSGKEAKELEPFDKYLYKMVCTWHFEPQSGSLGKEMLEMINSSRNSAGLPELRLDETASKAAMSHARDMYLNDFFSHTSPTFGTPLHRLQRNFGIKPGWTDETDGELISKSSPLPSVVFNEWLRDNKDTLLDGNWNAAGLACLDNLWVLILQK